jgi:multiple sugar transport system substrate-binding protein
MSDQKNLGRNVSRRLFLKYAALSAGGAVLAGCAPAAVPTPAPTTPPQIVEVTKIVAGTPEKEVVVITATPEPTTNVPAKGKQPIIYWSMFGLDEAAQAQTQVDRFNQETGEQAIFMSIGWGNVSQKAQVAISGGNPPDLVSLWSEAYSWGPRGLLMPLEDYASASRFDGTGWATPAYSALQSEGHLWGTAHTLNMFAMHINKDLFEKAGFSANKPPSDIATLDEMADKLIERDANGDITRLGFLPWQDSNLFHWGWAFGANFYDEKSDKVLCGTDAKLLEALTWFQTYAKKYDINKIDRFVSGFGKATMDPSDPWYVGKVVMQMDGSWKRSWIPRYAPKLNYIVSKSPTQPPVPPVSLLEIGAMFNIPVGAKNPDGAWKLALEFASKRCQIEFGTLVGDIPPLIEAAQDPDYMKALPFAQVFIDLEQNGGQAWPKLPSLSLYQNEMNRAVDNVIHGKAEPQQALTDVATKVQKDLDDFRSQTQK